MDHKKFIAIVESLAECRGTRTERGAEKRLESDTVEIKRWQGHFVCPRTNCDRTSTQPIETLISYGRSRRSQLCRLCGSVTEGVHPLSGRKPQKTVETDPVKKSSPQPVSAEQRIKKPRGRPPRPLADWVVTQGAERLGHQPNTPDDTTK
jgi:hypothetical protein